MADPLRFRWRVADGTLRMVWTQDLVDMTFDPASHAGGARHGLDAVAGRGAAPRAVPG